MGKLNIEDMKKKNDDYFLSLYKNKPGIKKIIRQYYPLKDNEKVILWERK